MESSSAAGPRILVVDDDPFITDLLKSILESIPGRVITARDGMDALEQCARHPDLDLVITDIEMPRLNGLDLIQRLGSQRKDLPIIVLTENQQIAVAINALKTGAYDYLIKDENIEDTVLLSVAKALEKRRLQEQNRLLVADLAAKNQELAHSNELLSAIIGTLTSVGTALSSQRNLLTLLGTIVTEAGEATKADGCTLYLLEENQLHFKIVQNRSLKIFIGGASGTSIQFAPIALDQESIANVSAYCALKKEIVNIADLYQSREFDLSGPKEFDRRTGYHTQSMLVLPMINREEQVIGVLQLINSIDPDSLTIREFGPTLVEIAKSLASQAAIAVENARAYEQIERKNLAFKRFVPVEFLTYLGHAEIEQVRLGDTTHEQLAVLFADIRSFTKLSEKLTPGDTFLFLNEYMRFMGPAITGNGGFIDKYIGDAIMALFSGGAADTAVRAAIAMQVQVRALNLLAADNNWPVIAIGVGVHIGPLTLGTIGFEERMDSTVIGDTVNLAARMESLTKQYGVRIAITEATFRQLAHPAAFDLREIDTVQVVGKDDPVKIYDVFDGDEADLRLAKRKSQPDFERALASYHARRWTEAGNLFQDLNRRVPADKVFALYLDRCLQFQACPPGDDWISVVRLLEK